MYFIYLPKRKFRIKRSTCDMFFSLIGGKMETFKSKSRRSKAKQVGGTLHETVGDWRQKKKKKQTDTWIQVSLHSKAGWYELKHSSLVRIASKCILYIHWQNQDAELWAFQRVFPISHLFCIHTYLIARLEYFSS